MPSPHFLTVYIAERGTPHFAPDGSSASKSDAGHMWYNLQKEDSLNTDESSYTQARYRVGDGKPHNPLIGNEPFA